MSNVSAIDIAYLSSYRQTVLILTTGAALTPSAMSEILADLSPPLDGRALSELRTRHGTFVLLRALEDESQVVFQLVCDSAMSDSVAKWLDAEGVRRVLDRAAASQAIGVIPRSGS